ILSRPRQFFAICNEVALHLPPTYGPTNEPSVITFTKTLAADKLPSSQRLTSSDVKEFFPWYSDYESLTWKQAVLPIPLEESAMGDSPYADVAGGPNREVIDFLFGAGDFCDRQWVFGDVSSRCRDW